MVQKGWWILQFHAITSIILIYYFKHHHVKRFQYSNFDKDMRMFLFFDIGYTLGRFSYTFFLKPNAWKICGVSWTFNVLPLHICHISLLLWRENFETLMKGNRLMWRIFGTIFQMWIWHVGLSNLRYVFKANLKYNCML